MFRALDCIVHQHDLWLLALAIGVCLSASATAMRTFTFARSLRGAPRLAWLAASGIGGGGGVWATHFIAMLAYAPGLATGYDPIGTMLSLGAACIGISAALAIVAASRRREAVILGGVVLLISIASMHALGMEAFRTQGVLIWNLAYLGAAASLCAVFSACSLAVATRPRQSVRRDLTAALWLSLAIVSLHLVSMAAVTILPDSSLAVPANVLPNEVMGLLIGVSAAVIILAGLTTLLSEAGNQRRARRRLDSVFAALPNGLAYFDAADRYVLWNARYEAGLEAFGLKPQVGLTYTECVLEPSVAAEGVVGPEGRAWIEQRLALRRTGAFSREEQSPDGRWRRFEDNRTPEGGLVTSMVDITALKQSALDLAEARDAAEAANLAKSEFLANMSHEIRTPLNGVMGVADALALSPLSAPQSELVEIIRSSGATLNRLLCDILDMARVESGALELINAPFNLGEAMRDVAQLWGPRAEAKGIGFELRVSGEAERWVISDATRLKQIVANLVSNAVKFTQQGEVGLTIDRPDGAQDAYRISVRDTGVGFDGETQARLFGRFQQGDGSVTRRFGGSGLGLPIVRGLAQLMGGDVEARSQPGEGAEFVVTVPLAPSEAPRAAAINLVPAAPGVEHGDDVLKVLVVDDNANNRRLLETLLAHFGAQVVVAEDGEQGVAAWRDGGFDVVLMDMQMPVLDGLSATRRIRALEARASLPRTPILMVSANAMPEHIAASAKAGADDHLAKPLSAEKLFAALAALETMEGQTVAA